MTRSCATGMALAALMAISTISAFAAEVPSAGVPVLAATPSMNGTIDDSWVKAAKLSLDTDFTYKRPAAEPTQVYVAQDGSYLDLAFVVTQKEPRNASQETNSSSVLNDDYVGVYLYPQGTTGISYGFFANPNGARYQTSSENSAYSPQWTAVARATAGGYVLTMRIPLNVVRSGGSTSWKAQLVRSTVSTSGISVWSYDARAQSLQDPAFAGTLTGIGAQPAQQSAARPKPRVQVYGLGEATTPANGGNTSRVGADFSLPVSPTASFVGTLHPDYSNVEVDQQTIAPNAFARQYSEVRPFFTQSASYFNQHFSCSDCPLTLYTPSVPTFGQGYALEGTQGHVTFAAYDAIADGRSDNAETVDYGYEDPGTIFSVDAQRVGVDAPGLTDVTSTIAMGYDDQKLHLFGYLNEGEDRGTNVTDPAIGNYVEGGIGYLDSTTTSVLNVQSIGAQFNPVDGYVAQTDIDGYEFFNSKTLNFSPKATLHDISANAFYARYDNRFGQLAQTDASVDVNFDFKDLMAVHLYTGSNGIRVLDGEFLPFADNGAMVGYKIDTPTPEYVSYSGGGYYHGKLDVWDYVATVPVVRKVHLGLELDEDQYLTTWPGESTTRQWLERASLDWQLSRDASFDAGVRRIVGPNIPNAFEPLVYNDPAVCAANAYNPGCYVNASNVSLAFHLLASKNEFYVVYGNADDLSTEPALFLKWIRYIGAEKGT
ncbi:MAG: hypothetical protein ACLQPV_07040 [Vulcanimicrobiaceae bacterium]